MSRLLTRWLALALCLAACGRAQRSVTVERDQPRELPRGESLGEMYVVEAGSAQSPPLVLVHGLGEKASDDWTPLLGKLAESFHVFAPDLPGFGRSEKGDALYSPANLAESLHQFVEERIQGPFILVGHSLGGAVSLQYAATHPSRLSKLVLIDSAGILHRSVLTTSLLSSVAWKGASWPEAVTARVENRGLDPGTILQSSALRKAFFGGNPNSIAALALIEHNFGPALDAVRTPTLLLWGSEDDIAPVRTGLLLSKRLANAELRVIEGVGHVPMAEAPAWVLEQLQSFVSRPDQEVIALKREARRGVARCQGERDWTLTGAFERVELEDCQGAKLLDVQTAALVVRNSDVEVQGGSIDAGGLAAVRVEGSRVRFTGTRIWAGTCVETSASRLDLAGVVARCTSSLVRAHTRFEAEAVGGAGRVRGAAPAPARGPGPDGGPAPVAHPRVSPRRTLIGGRHSSAQRGYPVADGWNPSGQKYSGCDGSSRWLNPSRSTADEAESGDCGGARVSCGGSAVAGRGGESPGGARLWCWCAWVP